MDIKLKNLLSFFHLKDVEMELFERILAYDATSASGLARQVNITRTSAYDYLARLKDRGLIVQTLKNGVRMYAVESPEKIEIQLKERKKSLASAEEALAILKDERGKHQASVRPRLQLFEGREALQQMMKDMLLYQNIIVRVYWPILDIIKLLTPQFLEKFQKERVQRNITLKTIWPRNQISTLRQYPFLKIGTENKREVHLAPKGVDFSLGYAVYENSVRFISSSRENFGFLILSRELARTMEGQFDIIWANTESFTF